MWNYLQIAQNPSQNVVYSTTLNNWYTTWDSTKT